MDLTQCPIPSSVPSPLGVAGCCFRGVENDLIGVSRPWYKHTHGKTAEEMKANI